MRLISRRISVATGATITTAVLAVAGVSSSNAGARVSARAAASTTPSAKVVAPAKNTKGVTLVVGDQAGTGAEGLLEAAGLLHKFPFKIKWADFTSGTPILEAEASGHVDIGGVGNAPVVFSAAGEAKVAIVGARSQGPNASALVVPAHSPITNIKQLAGKSIAVAEGSAGEYHLLTVLEKAGLKPSQVTLDSLQPSQALAALQAGQVDAWDTWSPYVEQAVSKGDKILVNGKGYGSPLNYEVASDAALANAQKVAAIKIYLTELNKAYVWEDKHPAAWAANWAKSTGLPLSIMKKAAKDEPEIPEPVNSTVVKSEQQLTDAFYSAGLIPKKVNFAPFATSAFSSAAKVASAPKKHVQTETP
jgi:sulfonate transport system substrate-binding protein